LYSVDFSATDVVITSGAKLIRFWEGKTGENLFRLDAHRDSIPHVSISEKGNLMATASADDSAKLWPAANPDEVSQVRRAWQAYLKRTADSAGEE